MKKTLIVCVMLLASVACQNKEATNTTAAQTSVAQNTLSPEQLGELGAKIQKNPNDAEKLLTEHGMTQDTFQQAVRKVAESPELSKQYAAGFKKVS